MFHYNTTDNKWGLWIMGGCFLLLSGILVGPAILKAPRDVREFGWRLGLAPYALLLLYLGSKGVLVWMGLLRHRETKQRRRQQITVCPEGLSYRDDSRQCELVWNDVTDFYRVPFARKFVPGYRYVIVTADGSFDFTWAVNEPRLLMAIIAWYAQFAHAKEWRDRESEDLLGGRDARWSGGCEGVGERVFRYRTRMNRAMLWLLGTYAVAPLCAFLLDAWFGLSIKRDDSIWVVFGLIWVAWVWAFWRYRTAYIQIDSRGITQNTIWGKRFLAWAEVQDYYKSGGDALIFGSVVGAQRRVRFWLGIADADELLDEIARRAVPSRSREWKQKE